LFFCRSLFAQKPYKTKKHTKQGTGFSPCLRVCLHANSDKALLSEGKTLLSETLLSETLSCQRPSLVKDPLLSETLSELVRDPLLTCQKPSLNLSETLSCQRPRCFTHTHTCTHTHTHTYTHTHTHTHTHTLCRSLLAQKPCFWRSLLPRRALLNKDLSPYFRAPQSYQQNLEYKPYFCGALQFPGLFCERALHK